MPIYLYTCVRGHTTEFLKLKKSDKPPEYCTKMVTEVQQATGRPETFECGLPLEKQVAVSNWKYTRGKNPLWPLADTTTPGDFEDE